MFDFYIKLPVSLVFQSQNYYCKKLLIYIYFFFTTYNNDVFRALLLGLASNPALKDVSLDLSCCEVRLTEIHVIFEVIYSV